MNFEFSDEEYAFRDAVERFIEAHHDPEVMDVSRDNMSQLVDTPERRAFLVKLAAEGWLGISWPEEYGGQAGEGVFEYFLNEALARVGAPQIGKGVGIIGKTLMRHGSEKLKQEFLPRILNAEIEFAVGYSEPQAGSDAANMQLRATPSEDGEGWTLNGQKIFTTSAHFADWYWVGARSDPDAPKHRGITLFLIPMDHPGLTIQSMPTIGHEITNQVFFDDVYVSDEYRVGELNRGFQYISEALDLERFTLFPFSPVQARVDLLVDHVKQARCDDEALKDDPVVRDQIADLVTEAEVARVLGLRVVAASIKGGAPPTAEAAAFKLFTTEFSKRLAAESMEIGSPGTQLRLHTEDAPMKGRAEGTYRSTVNETIGGGASEIQKNILARRKLGLPKNF
ncbi:MAG: acyl-CoA dehydrogenase family protein [Deltaproteobacteria bacterium]|nr:acyl-CoA dehydrogenase family protein [Deltaproteobacteria bacterium]MBW2419822.1 acyl-CoA dehydrogenase family protein [Deltaproteobacteria bacterium]